MKDYLFIFNRRIRSYIYNKIDLFEQLMRQRQNIQQVNSVNNLPSQHLLSGSKSNIQRLDSHIKSSLAHLQGKQNKKYLYVKMHNSFVDGKDKNCTTLIKELSEQFQDKIEIKYFKQTKELLADNYDDNQLHYIFVPEKELSWAETFARQEREESNNKKKIYVYGLLKKNVYADKIKARSKKKVEKIPDYINYYQLQNQNNVDEIVRNIQIHLEERLKQEGNHVKTWALTNKFAGKSVKKRTLHFYYEQKIQKQLIGMYNAYKKKAKSSWIQIYKFITFQDILRKIRQRTKAYSKQVQTAKQVTSRILKSTSEIESPSSRSIFMEGATSQLNSSILSSSIRAINKVDQNDVNIIIAHGHHPEMEKFRALVRAQKYGNWFLWEIQEGNSDFFEQLKDFLNEQQKNDQQKQNQQFQAIVHSKSLIILALSNDSNTINMFNNQQNVLHNMQLLLYNDAQQFSILLRQGVQSADDFVIAVVPGGFKSFATEYAHVITEFDSKYKNIDCVENYKFISNANGRHVSNIASSNLLLGTQSNLTYFQDNGFLQNIMRERDKHFHPLLGLKGHNVYLLIKQTIQSNLTDLRQHISNSPRLHISTYIDKQFLKRQIQTITLKDSVIIITNDSTLREAQTVARKFDQVSILNITERENAKEEIKVICSGKKEQIYQLIKSIPETQEFLQSQVYEEDQIVDESYTRKNRILPKKINFRPGDTISIRLPSNLNDIQSRKMQVRLQKYFKKQIKIEYYKQPKDVRLVNKNQQPLSFIIWTDKSQTKQMKDRRNKELQYFKELAQNQIEQLREEFIIYSTTPKLYSNLIVQPAFQRFKFVSNHWQRIQQYIIGSYKNFLSPEGGEDTIFSDEMIRVFFNDKDKSSKDLISTVSKRRDNDDLNAANKIQFHLIDDLQTTLEQQSPYHKYYIIYNEDSTNNKYPQSDLIKLIDSPQYKHIYIKIILIYQDKAKKIQAQDGRVRKIVNNQIQAAEWLCKVRVIQAEVEFIVPHVVVDKNSLEYYYFMEKYSKLTGRFTFAYCATKQDVRNQLVSRKNRVNDQFWIIVKDIKSINQYSRYLQRNQNFKNVKFILQSNDNLTSNIKQGVIFKNDQKKQIQKFLLNIYRRDKRIFFPSTVKLNGPPQQIILLIMNGVNGRPIPINKQQKTNWEDILKAKIITVKDMNKLNQIVKQNTVDMIYVVYPFIYEKDLTNLCVIYKNLKRIPLVPFPQYDPRKLKLNFIDNNNKIYIGTYPAEITDYLRILRYNLRKSQQFLQKRITNELIEINIQKDYKLTEQQLGYLKAKNDSIIINSNGYQIGQINNLLNRVNKFNYLQIFIGDQQSNKIIGDFNEKKGKDVQFIDAKASPLLYMKGEKNKNHLLETNERDELITYLYNIPENRYLKAINNRGKFILYCNPQQPNISNYLLKIKQICLRNPKIQLRQYKLSEISSVLKQPGVILINSQSEKEYLQKVKPVNNINYLITNEQYNPQKNYASYGNKYFITKQNKQFQNFINQLATNYQANLQPILLNLDQPSSIFNNINQFKSTPISNKFVEMKLLPPFSSKPAQEIQQLIPIEMKQGVIDNSPPTLLNIDFPEADIPSLPLGFQKLKKIKEASVRNQNQILKPGLDTAASQNWFTIKSEADSFSSLPRSIQIIPKPAPPMKLKLAVLHPNTKQFINIGEMLRRNLQPEQFNVSLIQFKSQHQLQEYSKNNGQKLNGYDKIIVFLSNLYRKYDPNLRLMKSKLNNRMEYFIFDDNFHVNNHNLLKNHLRPYKIKQYSLPYASTQINRNLTSAQKIAILVPQNLLKKYQGLKSNHISVIPYLNQDQVHSYLHKDGYFILLIVNKQNYHSMKLNAKVSPRCMLIIDTPKDLLDDQLYLHRISTYSLYYGPDANDYLRKILPNKPGTTKQQLKFLFYSPAQEDLVFQSEYDDYDRICFKDWRELYQLLLFPFRDFNNWLIKNSPVKPQLIPLHPKVYLEAKDYMKDFKNNFTEMGYLNEDKIARKSTLVLHQYAQLPQVYYTDEKQLSKYLQKQQCPSIILYNASNMKIGTLRNKFIKHKWIGLTDNSERWINTQGELLQVSDDRLLRKQDMFANMFNNRVFDQYNDMKYYYLSNKAHIDHNRNIYFRNKEQLLETYSQETNLLMVIFVQAKDINHIPQILLAQSEQNGRVKLILLKIDFVDDYDTLYIKFNEIDPVIKHINAVQAAGRIDFIVYNQSDGERTRQTLIQRRKLKNFQNKPYSNFIDVDDIARNIKGRYKKVFTICFPDQKQQIENIFNQYAIQNKGIPNEGVEFIMIDRLSSIRPNPSYISNIRENSKSPLKPDSQKHIQTNTLNIKQPPQNKDSRSSSQKDLISTPFIDNAVYTLKPEGRNNIAQEYLEKQKNGNDYIEEEDFQLPNTQSNIKPNKMDQILANKNYLLNVDEKLKGLFPINKFSPNKVRYFTNPKNIPQGKPGVAQLIISTNSNPQLVSLSEQPDNFVVVVGKGGRGLQNNHNTLVIQQQQIPGLIKRLENNSNVEDDQLNIIRNLDDYDKVRVVYDKNMDIDSKRRLLAISEKNKKIYPTIYKGVGKLKEYMQEPDSLLMLMMSYDPENLQATVAQQNKVIVKKRRVKMIVPKKSESDVDGLETILEEEQADQQNQAIKKLTNQQVDLFLKIYQNTQGERPPVTQPDDWQGQREVQREYGEAADLDNITKLNVHSNIRPQNLFRQDEIEKIKQRLTGDLIVLVIDSSKRQQVDEAVNKYNVLVQAYTNSMNLQNDIRDRKDNVTLAVIDRNMLDKIPSIKKKYPHAAFILEADTFHDDGIQQYRPYLAGQIRKISDLQKIIADLYQQNEKIRYNAQNLRAASRFDMKKTSIVDVSNNQRFTVGLSNQKSKKVHLFYKDPQNIHVKNKLSDTFNTINFVPYKSVAHFKQIIGTYNNYSSILIANGNDIPQLQDFVSKKKQMIYVIRFNPPADLRENPKVKKLFSTYKKDDLQKFIFDQFQKYSFNLSDYNGIDLKYKSPKNAQGKRYIQKYQPNTFGTTPRFPGDFVPPKSKESTYSRKYMKSTSSRSKLTSRLQALSPKSPRNDYYPS